MSASGSRTQTKRAQLAVRLVDTFAKGKIGPIADSSPGSNAVRAAWGLPFVTKPA